MLVRWMEIRCGLGWGDGVVGWLVRVRVRWVGVYTR